MTLFLHHASGFNVILFVRRIWKQCFLFNCRLGRGKPQLWTTKSYAGYYSYIGGTHFSRTLESMVRIISIVGDADRGQPLPYPMQPQARIRTYARRIGRGQPFPKSLEFNASPTLHFLLWESSDDISTSVESVR